MMTREQIERIAEKCGVEVSYTEPGKGGFIIDSNDFLIKYFERQGESLLHLCRHH